MCTPTRAAFDNVGVARFPYGSTTMESNSHARVGRFSKSLQNSIAKMANA
jgi:hypothetical protein